MTAEMVTALGAFIAGISGIISAILLNRKTMALLEFRMKRVEEKLDKHNGYAEKFGNIEIDIAKIQKDVEYIKLSRDNAGA